MSAWPRSIHIWGFFDEDGNRRLPDGGAPSDLSPFDHYRVVEGNTRHFGGEITKRESWRDMGSGWLVSVSFETPERDNGNAARMWHVISEPRQPWTDPSATGDPA